MVEFRGGVQCKTDLILRETLGIVIYTFRSRPIVNYNIKGKQKYHGQETVEERSQGLHGHKQRILEKNINP
jgi:hypothetical protein